MARKRVYNSGAERVAAWRRRNRYTALGSHTTPNRSAVSLDSLGGPETALGTRPTLCGGCYGPTSIVGPLPPTVKAYHAECAPLPKGS